MGSGRCGDLGGVCPLTNIGEFFLPRSHPPKTGPGVVHHHEGLELPGMWDSAVWAEPEKDEVLHWVFRRDGQGCPYREHAARSSL
jgi:hypothetical protein